MSDTQKTVYALSLRPEQFRTSVDDAVNLEKLNVTDCYAFPSFAKVASTWDMANMRIVDSAFPEGPKYITFAQMLKYNTIPLAQITGRLLEITKDEMKCDVEIEFAADVAPSGETVFSVLQVRPISVDTRYAEVNWDQVDPAGAILTSSCALGTGWVEGVRDVIYVKHDSWDVL